MSTSSQNPDVPMPTAPDKKSWIGKAAVIGIVATMLIVIFIFREYISLEFLAEKESQLKDYYESNPIAVFTIAFLLYVLVTGLSLPGALIMSLTYAWFFGFLPATILISFASTLGATLAFLLSRYLLRNWIQNRFEKQLKTVNEAFEREGAFYLLTARLIPLVPFWLINLVMGLTKIRVGTFWIVSQLGMLAGTVIYVYAGSLVPSLRAIEAQGVGAVFNSNQLAQLTVAFTLLGVFPILAKKIVDRIRAPRTTEISKE